MMACHSGRLHLCLPLTFPLSVSPFRTISIQGRAFWPRGITRSLWRPQYREVNGDDGEEGSFVVVTVVLLLLLFVEGVPCVLVVLVLEEVLITPELLIPLSHLHNVIWLSPLGLISSIPAAIIPFNGARIPVELVSKTSIMMPLPPPSGAVAGLLNCTISYNVAFALSPFAALWIPSHNQKMLQMR